MTKISVILITGYDYRHKYLVNYMNKNPKFSLIKAYCERKNILNEKVYQKNTHLIKKHLIERTNHEKKFFKVSDLDKNIDFTLINRNEINSNKYVNEIKQLNPDFIISYGCSIIKSDLIDFFNQRFINIHLGLSPYYRGSGTNFWPFVNNELQSVGTTFMIINETIDGGKILHQIRAEIFENDTIHDIGNRLIKRSFQELTIVLLNYKLIAPKIITNFKISRYYKTSDFDDNSIIKALNNLNKSMIKSYLKNKEFIDNKFLIINAFK